MRKKDETRRFWPRLGVPLLAVLLGAGLGAGCSSNDGSTQNGAADSAVVCQDLADKNEFRQAVINAVRARAKAADKSALATVAGQLRQMVAVVDESLGGRLTKMAGSLDLLSNGKPPSGQEIDDLADNFQALGQEVEQTCKSRVQTTPASIQGDSSPAIVPVSYETAMLAGPDKGMCSLTEARGKIPGSFPLAACFDGNDLLVINELSVPIMIYAAGASAPTFNKFRGVPTASAAVAKIYGSNHNLLMPKYQARFHIGANAAKVSVERAPTTINETYVVAKAVYGFTPLGPFEALKSIPGMIIELADVGDQYIRCLKRASNGWAKLSCWVIVQRNVYFAIGRAGLNMLSGGLMDLVLALVDSAFWLKDDWSGKSQFDKSVKSFDIAAAPKPKPPVVEPPVVEPPVVEPPIIDPPVVEPPLSAIVTIQNMHLAGSCCLEEDSTAAYLSTRTIPSCRLNGCKISNTDMGSGDTLKVTCWTEGATMTNENKNISTDDNNPNLVNTDKWYRGVRNGQTGYISQVYVVAGDRGTKGLPHC